MRSVVPLFPKSRTVRGRGASFPLSLTTALQPFADTLCAQILCVTIVRQLNQPSLRLVQGIVLYGGSYGSKHRKSLWDIIANHCIPLCATIGFCPLVQLLALCALCATTERAPSAVLASKTRWLGPPMRALCPHNSCTSSTRAMQFNPIQPDPSASYCSASY